MLSLVLIFVICSEMWRVVRHDIYLMVKLVLIFDIKEFLPRNRGQNKQMMTKTLGLFVLKKQVGDMKQPPVGK